MWWNVVESIDRKPDDDDRDADAPGEHVVHEMQAVGLLLLDLERKHQEDVEGQDCHPPGEAELKVHQEGRCMCGGAYRVSTRHRVTDGDGEGVRTLGLAPADAIANHGRVADNDTHQEADRKAHGSNTDPQRNVLGERVLLDIEDEGQDEHDRGDEGQAGHDTNDSCGRNIITIIIISTRQRCGEQTMALTSAPAGRLPTFQSIVLPSAVDWHGARCVAVVRVPLLDEWSRAIAIHGDGGVGRGAWNHDDISADRNSECDLGRQLVWR